MFQTLLICLVFVLANVHAESCKTFQIKKEHMNKHLIRHKIIKMFVNGHHDCVRECFYVSVCRSIAYIKHENACELNDIDSESADTKDFESKPGALFSDLAQWPSEIAGPCGQRPCTEKERCFINKDSFLCREIVCGNVSPVVNGDVKLDKAGAMSFNDTATVTCLTGYQPDVSMIKCQVSGMWETASCLLNG